MAPIAILSLVLSLHRYCYVEALIVACALKFADGVRAARKSSYCVKSTGSTYVQRAASIRSDSSIGCPLE